MQAQGGAHASVQRLCELTVSEDSIATNREKESRNIAFCGTGKRANANKPYKGVREILKGNRAEWTSVNGPAATTLVRFYGQSCVSK